MFYGCTKFNEDLNDWNVTNVRTMKSMFYKCKNFDKPLNKWKNKMNNVEDMTSMFENCSKFNQDLSEWDLRQTDIKILINIFKGCDKLEEKNKPKIPQNIEASEQMEELENIEQLTNKEAYDLIEGHRILTPDILNEDGIILLLQPSNYFLFNKEDLIPSLDVTRDDNALVFICKKVDTKLFISNDMLKSEQPYFNLQNIGMTGFILASEMRYMLNNEHKFYVISKVQNEEAPSVVSWPIYKLGSNVVSGNHCQEGRSGQLYKIQIGKYNFEGKQGGSKRKLTKRNTKKRNTKKRNTKKRRHNIH